MHNDNLSYAPSFEEALSGLFGAAGPQPVTPETAIRGSVQELVQQAADAFDNYLGALGDKNFERAASELATLQQTLHQLLESAAPATADTVSAR
jgi:hypothetical protein